MEIKNKEKILEILDNAYGYNPFNGCCLMFAEALQMKYGGEIYVVYSKKFAEHAVLLLDGKLHDFAYSLEPESFIKRLNEDWSEGYKIIGYRKFEEEDLRDMKRDKELSSEIVKYI